MENIDALVTKYLKMLGLPEGPRPVLKVRSNLGAKWLGRCVWSTRMPENTTVELQKAILDDPGTLERVLAHELCHHVDFMKNRPDPNMVRLGLGGPGHGKFWNDMAAIVNAAMGKDFVTEKSDQTYVLADAEREFFVLVLPLTKTVDNTRFSFAWAARIGPKVKPWLERKLKESGGKLFKSRDQRLALGAKMKAYGGTSLPKDPALMDLLRKLYTDGESLQLEHALSIQSLRDELRRLNSSYLS